MSDTNTETTKCLSKEGGVVQDVKFYYRSGCTQEDLNDFRQKAWAQINSGHTKQDTTTDW